jgi:hypothetical protein
MKIYQIISFCILIFQIQAQTQANNVTNNNDIKKETNQVQINQTINTNKDNNNNQKINPTKPTVNTNQKVNNNPNPKKIETNKVKINEKINTAKNNTTVQKEVNKPKVPENKNQKGKEDEKNKLKEGVIKKDEEKPFNLTESLINFFEEMFGSKKNDSNTSRTSNEVIDTEDDKIRKKMEEEKKKKLEEERDRKRKEEKEKAAKLEKVKIEEQKKKEKQKKFLNERYEFMKLVANTTFEEVVQINLQKGEKETLYLDLESFTKIKIIVFTLDSEEEEKFNLFVSGPNARGRTSIIYQLFNKNQILWDYETLRKGEYLIEIVNKGTKENEFYLHLSKGDKKKDNINPEKIDKISMLLNEIDINVNQLRNKKKIEIKQVNSHNYKVTDNNKWIVIYSIIEICTMIMIFLIQSCYINSLVTKM